MIFHSCPTERNIRQRISENYDTVRPLLEKIPLTIGRRVGNESMHRPVLKNVSTFLAQFFVPRTLSIATKYAPVHGTGYNVRGNLPAIVGVPRNVSICEIYYSYFLRYSQNYKPVLKERFNPPSSLPTRSFPRNTHRSTKSHYRDNCAAYLSTYSDVPTSDKQLFPFDIPNGKVLTSKLRKWREFDLFRKFPFKSGSIINFRRNIRSQLRKRPRYHPRFMHGCQRSFFTVQPYACDKKKGSYCIRELIPFNLNFISTLMFARSSKFGQTCPYR